MNKEAALRYIYDPDTGIIRKRNTWRIVQHRCGVAGKQFRIYQMAFLLMKGYIPETVDHEDGDVNNNKWSNLRAATRAEQSANTTKAGIRCWPTGKYYYQLCVLGKRIYKSGFNTRVEAQESFDKLCLELQGDFAVQLRSK